MLYDRSKIIMANCKSLLSALDSVCEAKSRQVWNQARKNEEKKIEKRLSVRGQGSPPPPVREKLWQIGGSALPHQIKTGLITANIVRNIVHGVLIATSVGHHGCAYRNIKVMHLGILESNREI